MTENLLAESIEVAVGIIEMAQNATVRAGEISSYFSSLASSAVDGKPASTIINRENFSAVIDAMETLHCAMAELANTHDALRRAVATADNTPDGTNKSVIAISTAASALLGAIGTLTRATFNLLAFASSPEDTIQALETTVSSAHAALGKAVIARSTGSPRYHATLAAVEGANDIVVSIKTFQGSKVPIATIAGALDHTYRLATATAALLDSIGPD